MFAKCAMSVILPTRMNHVRCLLHLTSFAPRWSMLARAARSYEASPSRGGVCDLAAAGGLLPVRRGPSQTERHSNRHPAGGAHAAGQPQPVGAEPGPDGELHPLFIREKPPARTLASHQPPTSRLPRRSCTSAWATWSAARGATATPPPKAPPTHDARPAGGRRGAATGMACAARAAAAATVRPTSLPWN